MVGAIIDDNYDAERRQKSTQQNPQSTSFERDQHTQEPAEASQSIKINSSMWTRDVLWFSSSFFSFSSFSYLISLAYFTTNRWRGSGRGDKHKEKNAKKIAAAKQACPRRPVVHEESLHSSTASRQCGDSLHQVNTRTNNFNLKNGNLISHFIFSNRNEVRGIENSFLEAEYQCRDGYQFVQRQKKSSISIELRNVTNLICRNRRWIGAKPKCKRVRSSSIENSQMQQQCDVDEATNCEHLCMKRPRSATNSSVSEQEVICYCHKGFTPSGTRCFGECCDVVKHEYFVHKKLYRFDLKTLPFPVNDCCRLSFLYRHRRMWKSSRRVRKWQMCQPARFFPVRLSQGISVQWRAVWRWAWYLCRNKLSFNFIFDIIATRNWCRVSFSSKKYIFDCDFERNWLFLSSSNFFIKYQIWQKFDLKSSRNSQLSTRGTD